MTWAFRLHFVLSKHQRFLADDAHEVTIETGDGSVILRSTTLGKASEPVSSIFELPREPIAKVDHLALFGSGYGTSEDAQQAADRWKARLVTALASMRMGADFGARAVGGTYLTRHGQAYLRQRAGLPPEDQRPVLSDRLGAQVFEDDSKPIFFGSTATLVGTSPVAELGSALGALVTSGYLPSDRDQLAFDTFGASHFVESPDARFLLLMVAVETLIEQQPRSERSRQHVAALIAQTNGAGLDEDETRSLISSMRWLELESITQAGKRLARTLAPRTYANEAPDTFFGKCYAVRSNLVHGRRQRPVAHDVAMRGEELRRFVADLLSGPLLRNVSVSATQS